MLKNFDIKQDAASPIIELIAHVHGNLLEINLYWAGKGSIYNPPASNGPLLSAISVIPSKQFALFVKFHRSHLYFF